MLKNVELKSINKKIEFNQQKLKEYQNDANRISNQTSTDNSQNMLMAIQLLNTQNLILSLQNGIENLIKEKENLINLKLKDDAKRQWFGNMQMGYGLVSENRYDLKSNLMNFGKNNKYYLKS